MKSLPKIFVYLAILSIILGIITKLLGIRLSDLGFSDVYPFRPQSFIDFADTMLLLALSFIGLFWLEKQ